MLSLQFITLALSLASFINAVTIGPSADLTVGNAEIGPDGFSRSYGTPLILLNPVFIFAITAVLS
jgi:hypothetical protein